MRTEFIFTIILSFGLLPQSVFVSRVFADNELFDAAPSEASDELFSDDSVEDYGNLFDAENDNLLFDEPPIDEDPLDDYPDTQRPDFGEIQTQIGQTPNISKVQELKTKIREEEDETKRQELADELTKELQKLFDKDFQKRDGELEKLEDRVSKLRASLDKRKAARDRIIKNRIESIMLQADGLGLPGENGYSSDAFDFGQSVFNGPDSPGSNVKNIKVVETYPDGSKKVVVRYMEMRTEQRQRQTPYTVMVPQVRTRTVNGEEQSYRVNVPEQRSRVETYSFAVPEPRERELIVQRGQSVQVVVNEWVQQRANAATVRPRLGLPAAPNWSAAPTQAQSPPPSLSPPVFSTPRSRATNQRPRLKTAEPANRRAAN